MRSARAFVQHSIVADSGDTEGTPVAIQEAMAVGLPVGATRHAGIAEAIVDGVTGFLVDERDVCLMTRRMLELADNPLLAAKMGHAGRERALREYSVDVSISRLTKVIERCVAR